MIALAILLIVIGAFGIYRGNSRGTDGLALCIGGIVLIFLGAVGVLVAAVRYLAGG